MRLNQLNKLSYLKLSLTKFLENSSCHVDKSKSGDGFSEE
jgi:hypothetical protein